MHYVKAHQRIITTGMVGLLLVGAASLRLASAENPSPAAAAPAAVPASQEAQGKKTVTPSGLTIIVTEEGTDAVAKPGDMVLLNYTGKLTDGKVFDTSLKPGRQPIQFTLGAGGSIKGFDEGVTGMKFMEKRQLIIPAALGYGATGSAPVIPPNATLIFDVQLVGIARLPAADK